MSDQPTQAGRPGRPLWGPVRRPGEEAAAAYAGSPDASSPDRPPLVHATAPSWRGGSEPGPGPDAVGIGPSGIEPGVVAVPPTVTIAGTVAGSRSTNPYAGRLAGDLYGPPATVPTGRSAPPVALTVPDQRPAAERRGPDPLSSAPAPSGCAPLVPPSSPYPRSAIGRHRTVLVSLVCAAVLVLAGSGVVWAVNRVPDPVREPVAVGPASVAPAPFSPPTSATSDPTVRSVSGLVQVDGAAAAAPLARPVVDLLERHFGAINARDYSTWVSTVVPRRSADQSVERWLQDYRSTVDSDVHVESISETDTGVVVALRFTSRQDVVDAPADLSVDRICWASRWPISGLPTGGRIGTAPKGTTTKQAC